MLFTSFESLDDESQGLVVTFFAESTVDSGLIMF